MVREGRRQEAGGRFLKGERNSDSPRKLFPYTRKACNPSVSR
ncbi:hypothetical protein V0288_24465 [Pannus brasiliensis CCIBt3594]|uniref:Uncharacterized protein n=1 Tax=Pannus brasiliensis CCIBt3594 TaxID=1427578 RepID=A0AAW9R1Z1_9CHRO